MFASRRFLILEFSLRSDSMAFAVYTPGWPDCRSEPSKMDYLIYTDAGFGFIRLFIHLMHSDSFRGRIDSSRITRKSG